MMRHASWVIVLSLVSWLSLPASVSHAFGGKKPEEQLQKSEPASAVPPQTQIPGTASPYGSTLGGGPAEAANPTHPVTPNGATPTAPTAKEETVSHSEATDIDAQGQTSAIETQDGGKPEPTEPPSTAGETGIL